MTIEIVQPASEAEIQARHKELSTHFPQWEKVKDLIDQFIDIPVNYRQSGHPGGSRSKVHALVVTLLSGAMRWDIRHPEKKFTDRFVLVGGHTVPLVYAALAVFNEALRVKYEQTGDPKYLVPKAEERQLTWEDLVKFRRNKGLSGHAEMEGKTLFLKFNTGPSGHGFAPALGQALALKMAGADCVRVWAFEGEGGLTPGAVHESFNSAYGLGLDNFNLIVDWNDFGIDDQPISSVVAGCPGDWCESHGWRIRNTDHGSDWDEVTKTILDLTFSPNPGKAPSMAYLKTRKGRGYGVYDNKSHGAPHPLNSPAFWQLRADFAAKYGAKFVGQDEPAPKDTAEFQEQFRANLKAVVDVIRADQELVDYLADALIAIGESVPNEIPSFRLDLSKNPWQDKRIYDVENYPKELFVAPGTSVPNRAALAKWGAWVNWLGKEHYNRPLFVASSADLAESTNIAGFGHKFGDFPGWGKYERNSNLMGTLLPQEITEFANSGIATGMASVNFSDNPDEEFQGFYGATSTYGAFVYLMYGPLRLFSQLAQDVQLKVGKILWVAGHSGPETADDSRTHFGIFSPGVTQLFPDGYVIDLHPWEHNEVPVVLGAAFAHQVPIVALHLTRPPIEIPDREALGMPSHFAAAKGAYIMRPYRADQKRMGTVVVQGTSSTANLVKVLPELDKAGLNVKVVAGISPQLFKLQPKEYQEEVFSFADKMDSMAITNRARRLMHDWLGSEVSGEYTISSDWDDRWRTGGNLNELIEEAHLDPKHILEGIERFVRDREQRLRRIAAVLE